MTCLSANGGFCLCLLVVKKKPDSCVVPYSTEFKGFIIVRLAWIGKKQENIIEQSKEKTNEY